MNEKLRSECIALIDRYLLRLPILKITDFDLAWQALKVTISSKPEFVVHPKFSSHIIGIYDFFNMPELYVPEEDHKEFRKILRLRISEKIKTLKKFNEEEKSDYIKNYQEDKSKADKFQKIIATKTPPAPGSDAHVLTEAQWLEEMQNEEGYEPPANPMEIVMNIFTDEQWEEMHPTRRQVLWENAEKIQHLVTNHSADPADLLLLDITILRQICYRYRAVDAILMHTEMSFTELLSLENDIRSHLLRNYIAINFLVNNIDELNIYGIITLPRIVQEELIEYRLSIVALINESNISLNKLLGLSIEELHLILAYPDTEEAEDIIEQLTNHSAMEIEESESEREMEMRYH